jgi:hypothetical protein
MRFAYSAGFALLAVKKQLRLHMFIDDLFTSVLQACQVCTAFRTVMRTRHVSDTDMCQAM